MNTAVRNELKRAYLFHEFTEDEIDQLIPIAKHEILNPGDLLFMQDGKPDAFYIVHYGSVRLQFVGPEGQLESSLMVGSGDVMGETAIALGLPRITSAEAVERTELISFPIAEMNQFLSRHNDTTLKFYRALSKHLANSVYTMTRELVRLREAHHIEKHRFTSV